MGFASLPSGAGLRKPDDVHGDLFRVSTLGLYRRVRLLVERFSRFQQLVHLRL
jgi:hypothetical protein